MITGMDRLSAAAKGEILDRVPVFCNLFEQGAKALGIKSFEEYYSKGENVAEAQIKMREKYGYDNVWNLFYVGREAEILGCDNIVFAADGPPNVGEYIIKSYDDIHNLRIPDDLVAHPRFEENVKCMEILKREVGGKYPIAAYVTSSMTLPVILMGMDKWIELLLVGPPDVRDELLLKCNDFFRKHISYYIEAGANCLVYSNPFASTSFLPIGMIDTLSFDWMRKDLEGIDRGGLIFYCGGAPFNDVIDRVFERLGFSSYYISPLADLDEARRIVSGRGLVCGAIDDLKLLRWTKEQVEDEVKRIMSIGMKDNKKFAFGVMGMPFAIPEENIRSMLEAAYKYGRG